MGQGIFGAFADLVTNPGDGNMPASCKLFAINELVVFDWPGARRNALLVPFIKRRWQRLLRRDIPGGTRGCVTLIKHMDLRPSLRKCCNLAGPFREIHPRVGSSPDLKQIPLQPRLCVERQSSRV